MNPFTLGRMRHLDLLALWHYLHPDGHHGVDGDPVPRMSKDGIVTAILNSGGAS